MNCAEYQDLINAYLDDELEEQLRTSLESHLTGCSERSREAANWRTTLGRLRETLPDRTPPAELWERIQARMETG